MGKDMAKQLAGLSPEVLQKIIDCATEELAKRGRVRGFEVARGFEGRVPNLPSRATPASGGYDFWPLEEITLAPGQSHTLSTGVKAYMPPNEILLINIRSSYGIKHGIQLCNEQGWIDSDYYSNPENDGVILIKVKNTGYRPFTFRTREPFAQGMFVNYRITDDDCPRLEERRGGIGHSSKK